MRTTLRNVAIAMIANITAVILAVSVSASAIFLIVSSRYTMVPIMIAHTPATAADSDGVRSPAYIPPSIMAGVMSPGIAFMSAFIFSLLVAFLLFFMCLHFHVTTMDSSIMRIIPGMNPAANVLETGTSVSAENSIAALEGGIRASRNAADAASTITNGLGYPCSTILGIMIVPTAVIAASIDPQNAAKNPIASIIAIPSPPGQCPTSIVAR